MRGEGLRLTRHWAMLHELAMLGQVAYWDVMVQGLTVRWEESYQELLNLLTDLLADGYVEISGDVAMLTKTGLDAARTWIPF